MRGPGEKKTNWCACPLFKGLSRRPRKNLRRAGREESRRATYLYDTYGHYHAGKDGYRHRWSGHVRRAEGTSSASRAIDAARATARNRSEYGVCLDGSADCRRITSMTAVTGTTPLAACAAGARSCVGATRSYTARVKVCPFRDVASARVGIAATPPLATVLNAHRTAPLARHPTVTGNGCGVTGIPWRRTISS